MSLKLVTSGRGTLDLSPQNGELFYTMDWVPFVWSLAHYGLGAFGVVVDDEVQCIPVHKLLEKTSVTNMKQVKRNDK